MLREASKGNSSGRIEAVNGRIDTPIRPSSLGRVREGFMTQSFPEILSIQDEEKQGPHQALGTILLSFGLARTGTSLLKIAHALSVRSEIHAMHFTPDPDASREEEAIYMSESYEGLKALSEKLLTPIRFLYRAARDINQAILDQVELSESDLLLVGATDKDPKDPLGGRVKTILKSSTCRVGVLINRGLADCKNILLLESAGEELSNWFEPRFPAHVHNTTIDSIKQTRDFSPYDLLILPGKMYSELPENIPISRLLFFDAVMKPGILT